MAGPPAAEWPGRPRPGPGGRRLMGAMQTRRREMALVLLLGVAGAGLVFLAVRQGWAHVRTAPPPPLPGSDSLVTGQDLVPAGGAPLIAGFPAHVAATAFPWRLLALAGGAAVIAAGLLVIWRAAVWPVMSG